MLDQLLRQRDYKLLKELARRKKLANWQEALRWAIENSCRKFAGDLDTADAEYQAERLKKWEALQNQRRPGNSRQRLQERQKFLKDRAERLASAPAPRPHPEPEPEPAPFEGDA